MDSVQLYKRFLRLILFNPRLFPDPEDAHNFVKKLLKYTLIWEILSPIFTYRHPFLEKQIETNHGTLVFPNPVILAAGFDKDGELFRSLQYLGFGGITDGTFMPEAREGNEKPRIVRRVSDEAAVNAMGLPGMGIDYNAEQLRRTPRRRCPIIVSIGGSSIDDYSECLRKTEPYADVIEVNVSCPNTADGRQFERNPDACYKLIRTLRELTEKPLFEKLSPIEPDDGKLKVVDRCRDAGSDGVTAVNTKMVEELGLSTGKGGLSGKPLFEDALRTVAEVYSHTQGEIPIIGTGGIFTPEDAHEMMNAGASVVGIYTGMIYNGPGIVRYICEGLVRIRSHG